MIARLRTSEAGTVDTVSVIDGVSRITTYRKLQDYPVHVVYGVDKRNITQEWYPIVAAFGGLAAAAAGALLLTALVVIRRARGEAEALERVERGAVALQQSEANQRALFRNAPVPMYALDKSYRLVDANGRWLSWLATSSEPGTPIGAGLPAASSTTARAG